MDTRLVVAILIVVGLPALLIGYILLIEAVLRLLPGRWQNRLRPWLWIAPALSFLGFFLVYPTINTVLLSLQDKFSKTFVGLANYQYFFSNPDTLVSLRNNVIWIVLLTALAVGPGPAHRGARRPGALRAGGQVGHLPAAGDQLRRGRHHLAVRLRLRPRG